MFVTTPYTSKVCCSVHTPNYYSVCCWQVLSQCFLFCLFIKPVEGSQYSNHTHCVCCKRADQGVACCIDLICKQCHGKVSHYTYTIPRKAFTIIVNNMPLKGLTSELAKKRNKPALERSALVFIGDIRRCLLMGTMLLAPGSTHNCEVASILHGARVRGPSSRLCFPESH